jgi:predicted secreted Zn-dependent protease
VIPYDVAGRDPAAVRHSIDAARPTDSNDGKRVDGLSRYEYRWLWHDDGHGKCTSALEDISFSATVTIPRLVDGKAPPKLREQFDRYRQSLLLHEDGHIRYAWNHRGDIASAINAATCATADAAARAALKAIAEHDVAYDKATRHGATTVLPFG